MAKRSNGATQAVTVQQTAAQAPLRPATTTAAALADRALDLAGKEPAIVEWDVGNGVSTFAAGDLPPDVRAAEDKGEEAAELAPADAPDDAETAAGGKPKTDDSRAAATEQNQEDGGNEGGTVSPPRQAASDAKPKGAEARRVAFDRLAAEQRRVALETQARTEREKREAAEGELQRVRKLPLKEQLKWLGVDKESLSEAVLVGGDEVAELPDKKTAPTVDPVVEALKAEVDALKAEREQRAQSTAAQQITQGHQVVAEALKDVATVPMVKTVRDVVIDGNYVQNGYDLTLKTAHQAWLDAGKAGHPRDYVQGAAEVVEGWLRSKRPDLAELVDARAAAPAKKPANGTPAAKPPVSTSIGKRTAARPDAEPAELPLDRHLRDAQIKREFPFLR